MSGFSLFLFFPLMIFCMDPNAKVFYPTGTEMHQLDDGSISIDEIIKGENSDGFGDNFGSFTSSIWVSPSNQDQVEKIPSLLDLSPSYLHGDLKEEKTPYMSWDIDFDAKLCLVPKLPVEKKPPEEKPSATTKTTTATKIEGAVKAEVKVSALDVDRELQMLTRDTCSRPLWIPSMTDITRSSWNDQQFEKRMKSVRKENKIIIGKGEEIHVPLRRFISAMKRLPSHVFLHRICSCSEAWFKACDQLSESDILIGQVVSFMKAVELKVIPLFVRFFGISHKTKILKFIGGFLNNWKSSNSRGMSLQYSKLVALVQGFQALVTDFSNRENLAEIEVQHQNDYNLLINSRKEVSKQYIVSSAVLKSILEYVDKVVNETDSMISNMVKSIDALFEEVVDIKIPRLADLPTGSASQELVSFSHIEDYFFPELQEPPHSFTSKSILEKLVYVSKTFPTFMSPKGNIFPYKNRHGQRPTSQLSIYSLIPNDTFESLRDIFDIKQTLERFRLKFNPTRPELSRHTSNDHLVFSFDDDESFGGVDESSPSPTNSFNVQDLSSMEQETFRRVESILSFLGQSRP